MPGMPGPVVTEEEMVADSIARLEAAFKARDEMAAQSWRDAAEKTDNPEWKSLCLACAEAWENRSAT